MCEAIVDGGPRSAPAFSIDAGGEGRRPVRPAPRPGTPPASACGTCALGRCWLWGCLPARPGTQADLDARTRSVRAGMHVFHQGDVIRHAMTLVKGMAVAYRLFEDGRRQVLRILFPGDILVFPGWTPGEAECTAEALTDASLCSVPLDRLEAAARRNPDIAVCVAARLAAELRADRRHLAALGRLSARERLAALLLELHRRAIDTSFTSARSVSLPVNLALLADAAGLTPVHVCRTLKQMRLDGLLEWDKGRLSILDFDRLSDVAQLDPCGDHEEVGHAGSGRAP